VGRSVCRVNEVKKHCILAHRGKHWSDVDWERSTLQVERGIVEQNVDDVKTDDSRRTFTLAPELLSVLEK